MNIKKTLTTLALTSLLTATLAAPALAGEIVYPTATTGDSSVTATVDQTYTVTIPDTVEFGKLTKASKDVVKDLTVKVNNLLIDKDQALKINVKGDDTADAFTIRTTGGASIAYEVYAKGEDTTSGTPVGVDGLFASVKSANSPSDTQDISGSLKQTGAVVNAGNYTGTLTFTCSITPTP